ncbi:MAG: polyphosphate:AMP phosphotransferase [Myxococcales bacterium]|nr:polyphosphate:AMP phosphotransferase [Myxococcales bacterium]
MFESAELGHKVGKQEFSEAVPELRTQLLAVQRALRERDIPVLIIVSGVEGAGKSAVVNRLHEWLDPRGLSTHAFWDETDEERERPGAWRFWRVLPARGATGVMFGSWYTKPIIESALGDQDLDALAAEMNRIAESERMLTDDGLVIIKLWFHISQDVQAQVLTQRERQEKKGKKDKKGKKHKKGRKGGKRIQLSPLAKRFSKHYPAFAEVSERALRLTDRGNAPWHVIEATDRRYRDLSTGRILLERMQQAVAQHDARQEPAPAATPVEAGNGLTVLDHVDLEQRLEPEIYAERLEAAQDRLHDLAWKLHDRRESSVVAVFEGWDASGKGGAIRRVTSALDARLYRVIPIAAPTDEERAHHYLWRFWRYVPRNGYLRFYDRSWYGRVLVERVEGFAAEAEWSRAYAEINTFEEELARHGVIVLKFWIHISSEEQLRRFRHREVTEWKKHKLTDEDWRNRERRPGYEAAIHEMVSRTSTPHAPWTLVSGNDKRVARVQIVETFCDALARGLRSD